MSETVGLAEHGTTMLRRAIRLDGSAMAVVSLLAMVTAAVVSDADMLSAVLVATGVVLGAVPVWRSRHDRILQLAVVITAWWLLYGALVGSLPSPLEFDSVRAWASSEGRVLVAVAAIAVGRGVTRRHDLRPLCRGIVWIVTIGHIFALGLFLAGRSAPGFEIRLNDLFRGLTSSHHVVGFVAAAVIIIVLAVPNWFRHSEQFVSILIAVVSITASASRTSLLGIAAGGAVIALARIDRRQLVFSTIGILAVVSVIVASNSRFRATADVVTRREFASEVATAWSSTSIGEVRNISDSAVEANILLRVALWGNAWERFTDSPLIGIGVFRHNDQELEFAGVRHVVWLATDGDQRFNDAEPHNVILYLLEETGLVGLVLFSSPYVFAWRWSRDTSRSRDDETDADPDGAPVPATDLVDAEAIRLLVRATIVMAFSVSMVSSGVMATGLGLIANAVIFASCGPRPTLRNATSDLQLTG